MLKKEKKEKKHTKNTNHNKLKLTITKKNEISIGE